MVGTIIIIVVIIIMILTEAGVYLVAQPNTTAPDGQNHTWHIPITAHVVISLSLASRLTGVRSR